MSTIFIAGSSSGLGRATAKLFASKGWKVIASMRDPKREKELGNISGITLIALDVTDPHEIETVAQQVVASGGVDVVFNNAGYGLGGALEGLTDEQILRMVNTNMLGAIRTTRAFTPHFLSARRDPRLPLPCAVVGATPFTPHPRPPYTLPVTPPSFQPLPVKRRPQPFDHADWLFELKMDGFRALAYLDAGRCRLVSRNQNEFKSFGQLKTAIAEELRGHSVILDGEVVSLDEGGRPQFYELLFRRGEPRLCAFDLLRCDGEDLRYAPLAERKRKLRALLPESDRIFFCDHIEQYGESLFQLVYECDLEGIVAKRKYDPYLPRTSWFKIRNQAYSQWAGRHELFEHERESDPDVHGWGICTEACETV